MFRSFLILAATWGVCLTAMLPASPATAADKGKWWQSAKSSSSNGLGNGSTNGSANGSAKPAVRNKFSTTPQLSLGSGSSSSSSTWKKLQGIGGLGGNTTGGNGNSKASGLQLGKQYSGPLKLKQPIYLGGAVGGNQNGGNVLNGPGQGNFGGFRPNLPAFDSNKISDALKNGKIQPIQPNFGLGGLAGGGGGAAGNGAGGANGGAGNGSTPPAWLQNHMDLIGGRGGLAEDIRDGINIEPEVFNPPGNGGDAADPGQGDNGQADPNPGDDNPGDGNPDGDNGGNPGDDGNPGGNDGDPHDDDGHDHPFPWWPPIIIGGGGGHVHCPPSANITVIEQPLMVLPEVQNVPATVDLQLLDVRLVDAGDPARNLGPRFRLVFGNAGTVAVGNFRVLAMASRDGTPDPAAPAAAAEVISLAAGEVAMADVRLPLVAELPSMGALIVVVDSALQIAETDEQNNVAVLDRAAIAAVDLTAAATP